LKRFLTGIFCCIVLVYFTVVFTVEDNSLKQRMTEETTGVITQVISGSITVAHYVNSERYIGQLSNSWGPIGRNMREGRQIRIFYNPVDPRQIRSDNSPFVVTLMFAFVFTGLLILLFEIKRGWEELMNTSPGKHVIFADDSAVFVEHLKNMPQKEAESEIMEGLYELEHKLGHFENIIRLLPWLTAGFIVVGIIFWLLL